MLNSLKKYGTLTGSPTMGVLCHFAYDAKLKASLPTWDKFPLCIPTDPKPNGGWLGLNLHYISQGTRKVILDQLMKNLSFYDKNPRARMAANYAFLKAASLFPDVKPTIKHYLRDHVESQILNISPTYWYKIIRLPTARWTNGVPY